MGNLKIFRATCTRSKWERSANFLELLLTVLYNGYYHSILTLFFKTVFVKMQVFKGSVFGPHQPLEKLPVVCTAFTIVQHLFAQFD